MRILKKEALLFSIIFLLSISLTSAEVIISQTDALYNMGDDFEFSIKITSPLQDTSDFLTAKLLCGGEEVDLYKSPHKLNKGEEKEVQISTTFGRFLVSGMQGRCYVKAEYAESQTDSQRFELTSNVDVSLNIQGIVFGPDEQVIAFGEAKKSDDSPLEGFVEVTVSDIDFRFTGPIKEGDFNFNFTIPEDSPAGDYSIEARAYEKDTSGEIINEGKATNTIKIKSIMKEVEIALDSQTVVPKNELRYTTIIYDQAKDTVEADVSIAVYRPDGSILKKDLVKSGESTSLNIESNHTPGYWKLEATVEDLVETRSFFVEEFREVSFNLEGETLTITNIGNIPYTGPLEITIGGVSEVKNVDNLGVGASKQFRLVAPDGEYTIGVGDSSNTQELGTTFLTGNAISVEDIGGILGDNLSILITIIVILIIAIATLYIYRRVSKNKLPGKISKSSLTPLKNKTSQKEELSTVMDKGEKQVSTILSLRIKNPEALSSPNATKTLDSALWKAKEAGAKVYVNGEFRLIIFAPILTKEKDNTLRAVRVAQTIERILVDHNKRQKPAIDFGIGVNLGELIVGSKQGKFKFMSTDNTIATTKNISQSAKSEVLLSEKLHRATVGKIKTQKLPNKFWKLTRVVDRSAHRSYLKNLKS